MLYASGALGLYHRIRNADSLTAVMFHRTLDQGDPRWATCDPDYTLRRDLFARSLAFFKRHYNVVSLQDVLEARRDSRALPPRALLITFDDGWADNVDDALPELRSAGLPGLMFVVSDAVGRRQPFWQERLIAAWRRGTVRVAELAVALGDPSAPAEDVYALRAMITRLEQLDSAGRDSLLAPFAAAMDDGLRHMVDRDELQRLREGGMALGLHGKSHVRMTEAGDLEAELGGARAALAATLGDGERGADEDNPEGYYEWEAIKQVASRPEVLDEEGMEGRAIKCVSAHLLRLPPHYRYRVIFMQRPLGEVAKSQRRMIERRGTEGMGGGEEEIATALGKHREEVLDFVRRHPQAFELLVGDYPELVGDPERWAARVGEFLGPELVPHPERMVGAVRPELHRNRS